MTETTCDKDRREGIYVWRPKRYINGAWFGVAMAAVNKANTTRERYRQRRRLRRMLAHYTTHQDVIDYAMMHLEPEA